MSTLNGGILLGTANQAEAQFGQMRFAASLQIMAQLAAIDYSQAINRTLGEADPFGQSKDGEQVSLQDILDNCHPKQIGILATAYAEWLLAAQGFLRIEEEAAR